MCHTAVREALEVQPGLDSLRDSDEAWVDCGAFVDGSVRSTGISASDSARQRPHTGWILGRARRLEQRYLDAVVGRSCSDSPVLPPHGWFSRQVGREGSVGILKAIA